MADTDDLSLIPRSLRDKLDRVGVKLHLREWEQFTLAERRRLVDQPCASEADVDRYRAELNTLIRKRTGHAPDILRR